MNIWKEKTRLYKVYHIRMIGDEDLQSGYVGITRRSLRHRLCQHYSSKRPIGTVLRTTPKDMIEIIELCRGTREEALKKEYELRPGRNIGWNILAGGNEPTVMCPGCGKHLPDRGIGAYCYSCRPTKFPVGHKPYNYGKGEQYELIDPNGNIYHPEAFTVFCRENNLTPQNLRKVAKGTRKNHKGWIARKVS